MNTADGTRPDGRAAVQARQDMEALLKEIVVAPTVGALGPRIASLATAKSVGEVAATLTDIETNTRVLGRIGAALDEVRADVVGPDGQPSLREGINDVQTALSGQPTREELRQGLATVEDSVTAAMAQFGPTVTAVGEAVVGVREALSVRPDRRELEAMFNEVASSIGAVPESMDARIALHVAEGIQRVQSDLVDIEGRMSALAFSNMDAVRQHHAELAKLIAAFAERVQVLESRLTALEQAAARRTDVAEIKAEVRASGEELLAAEAASAQRLGFWLRLCVVTTATLVAATAIVAALTHFWG